MDARCAAPIGVAGTAQVDLASFSLGSEALPLALALWLFLGAGIWIFHRWSRAPRARAPEAPERAVGVRA